MPEYISRDAALIVLDWDCASQDALNAIKAIPAADVVEVRHGRWHDVYLSGASSFVGTCSVCGKTNGIPPVPLAKYCPCCGAKMDGGQDDARPKEVLLQLPEEYPHGETG